MASRHHSLQTSEVADVVDLLQGFQQDAGVVVTISFSLFMERHSLELSAKAVATGHAELGREAPILASSNVKTSSLNLRTMRDVVTHLLYMLDFQLELEKHDRVLSKKSIAPPHPKDTDW